MAEEEDSNLITDTGICWGRKRNAAAPDESAGTVGAGAALGRQQELRSQATLKRSRSLEATKRCIFDQDQASRSIQPPRFSSSGTQSSTSSSLSEIPTLLEPETSTLLFGSSSGDESTQQPTQTAATFEHNESSLFGAVMKKVQEKQPSSSSSTQPATPRNNNMRTDFNFAVSPGGFKLLDFINSVHSPFHLDHHNATNNNNNNNSPSGGSKPSPTGTEGSDQQTDWQETFVSDETVGLLDWTVYRSLDIETNPPASHILNAQMDQLAYRCFVSGIKATDDGLSVLESCLVDRKVSLLYWRYPSGSANSFTTTTQPFHQKQDHQSLREVNNSVFNEVATTTSRSLLSAEDLNSKHHPPGNVATSDHSSSMMMPPPSKKQAPRTSTTFQERKIDTQAWQWQQAFRSLYLSWIQRVRSLSSTTYSSSSSSGTSFEDCYFYSFGRGHSILFRASCINGNSASHCDAVTAAATTTTQQQPRPRWVPEILISASNAILRKKLRDMGVVQMRLLDEWEGRFEGPFQESWLEGPSVETDREPSDASPALKAELAALRRAQVFGLNAGPTVSVKITQPNRRKRMFTPEQVPPLTLVGWDDCAVFVEVYLNTFGQIHNGGSMKIDLPVLMCRKLGPFLHSSMETLTEKRGQNGFEIQGMLLPCAVRQLIRSTVRIMQVSENGKAKATAEAKAPQITNNSEFLPVGSRYAVFRAQVHPGFSAIRGAGQILVGMIGSKGTAWMNSRKRSKKPLSGNNESRQIAIKRLRCGQVLSLVVWDSTTAEAIAFRVGYEVGGLLDHKYRDLD